MDDQKIIDICECDVSDKELLALFRLKRDEWKRCLIDDSYSVSQQISHLLWNDTVFRTFNEARKISLDEKKDDWTNDQFIYKARKKALGIFKKDIHSLTTDIKNKISKVLEKEFSFLFEQLNIRNTKEVVSKYTKVIVVEKTKETFLKKDEE